MIRLQVFKMWGLFLIVVIVFLLPATGRESLPPPGEPSQGADTGIDQAKWVNLPEAPLIFEVAPNKRSLWLSNHGDRPIQGYQLACVNGNGSNIRLVRKLPPRTVRLEPKTDAKIDMILNPLPLSEEGRMICRSGAFAVWEVQFADGRVWKAK